MDIQKVLHDREVFLKALWYFEGNADLPVVKMQRIRYQNSRAEFLKHRDYIRTMARLRATESALGNTNEELERTAAALAAAEAEVARLRAALEAVAAQWPGLGCTIPEKWMSKERHYRLGFDDGRARVAVIARAALDICEEANHENG